MDAAGELKSTTFNHLFMAYWSRALLATEQCLVMNAVWGSTQASCEETWWQHGPSGQGGHLRSCHQQGESGEDLPLPQ
jgi:hypothetical protein